MRLSQFYKEHPDDVIWWTSDIDRLGSLLFSFDKKKIYNYYPDYPDNLTKEEKEIFDREQPYLASLRN